jgi:signal transduction histidine kinase
MIDLVLSTPLNAEQRDYLSAVQRASDNLLKIINDVLDIRYRRRRKEY